MSSASVKAKLFAKNLSKNSNLEDAGIYLVAFPSRSILKPHNISIAPKIINKAIINLDLLKASVPDCIPVVVLKNFESELSEGIFFSRMLEVLIGDPLFYVC